jgi:hypothetical protein
VIPEELLSINVRMIGAVIRVVGRGCVLTGASSADSSGDPNEGVHPVE